MTHTAEDGVLSIGLSTDTVAILILPPGHPIVLIEINLFFCSDNAHYHNNRINPVLWDAQGAKLI